MSVAAYRRSNGNESTRCDCRTLANLPLLLAGTMPQSQNDTLAKSERNTRNDSLPRLKAKNMSLAQSLLPQALTRIPTRTLAAKHPWDRGQTLLLEHQVIKAERSRWMIDTLQAWEQQTQEDRQTYHLVKEESMVGLAASLWSSRMRLDYLGWRICRKTQLRRLRKASDGSRQPLARPPRQ